MKDLVCNLPCNPPPRRRDIRTPHNLLIAPQCLFLSALSREIRFQIYNHFLLQYNLIHIVQTFTRKGLLSRRCTLEAPDIDPRPGHSSSPSPDLDDSDEPPLVYEWNKQVIQDRRWCPFERAYELPNYDTRAVLLTCRTTYEEIAPIFYRRVTWSMCDPLPLFRLESTIHPSYFRSIQHIQFSHVYYALGWDGSTFGPSSPRSGREQVLENIKRERWGDFWRILAGLHALKSLKVWIMFRSDFGDGEPALGDRQVDDLIACGLRGVKRVEVQIKRKHYILGLANGQPARRLNAVEEKVKQA